MEIVPVTADRWDDLLALFGTNGAYSNCWCTWWILTGKEFGEARPEERREILEGLVLSDQEPGLLAYRDGRPVGWCAVGPRQRYTRMMSNRSLVYKPPDELAGGWVINCFYIHRSERGNGVATALLDAAVEFAFKNNATAIDAYPLADTSHGSASLYVGTRSMFEGAGFEEIDRIKERPVMRRLR
jgi:GNAT superfamily N-acetyltransferase